MNTVFNAQKAVLLCQILRAVYLLKETFDANNLCDISGVCRAFMRYLSPFSVIIINAAPPSEAITYR